MLVFSHCDKIPISKNLKDARPLLTHSFRDFSPWPAGYITFSPVARQRHGRRVWWRKTDHFTATRKGRGRAWGEKGRGRGKGRKREQ